MDDDPGPGALTSIDPRSSSLPSHPRIEADQPPPDRTRIGELADKASGVGCLLQVLALGGGLGAALVALGPGANESPLFTLAAATWAFAAHLFFSPLILLGLGCLAVALGDDALIGLGVFPRKLDDRERLPSHAPTLDATLPAKTLTAKLPGLAENWRERGSIGQFFGVSGMLLGASLAHRGLLAHPWLELWLGFHVLVGITGFLQRAASSALVEAEARVPAEAASPGAVVPIEVRLVAGRKLEIKNLRLGLARNERKRMRAKDKPDPIESHWEYFPEAPVPVSRSLARGQEFRLIGAVTIPPEALPAVAGPEFRRRWSLTLEVGLAGWPDAFVSWRFSPLDDLPDAAPPSPGGAIREPLLVGLGVLATRSACPFCGDSLASGEVVACGRCDTLHHPDCWTEAGRCTVYACGCTQLRPVVLASRAPGWLVGKRARAGVHSPE